MVTQMDEFCAAYSQIAHLADFHATVVAHIPKAMFSITL